MTGQKEEKKEKENEEKRFLHTDGPKKGMRNMRHCSLMTYILVIWAFLIRNEPVKQFL